MCIVAAELPCVMVGGVSIKDAGGGMVPRVGEVESLYITTGGCGHNNVTHAIPVQYTTQPKAGLIITGRFVLRFQLVLSVCSTHAHTQSHKLAAST